MNANNLKQTCAGCPSQWSAVTDCGRGVYVRYRWGCLSVRVGPPGDATEFAAVRGQEIISESIGSGLDGIISWEEVFPYIAAFELSSLGDES